MDPVLRIELDHQLGRLRLKVAFDVGRETLALVGPSGAGKTSVLRAVAGLLVPDRGRVIHGERVLFDGERAANLLPEERKVGLVFQEGALFPNMSVAQNVGYGLRRPGTTRKERAKRVASMLDRLGIAHLAAARPTALSGGERQRVALARAIASDPQVLLLDEPLSALDAVTKARVAAELATRLRELHLPTILVSHDFGDVVGLADRVAVMERGRIVQQGTTEELLRKPASSFVAAFAGVNYFLGHASKRGILTEIDGESGARFLGVDEIVGPVGVVVYPWDVAISSSHPAGSALNALEGPIVQVARVGNRVRVTVGSTPPIVAEVTAESARGLGLVPGVPVIASWKATGTRLVQLVKTSPATAAEEGS